MRRSTGITVNRAADWSWVTVEIRGKAGAKLASVAGVDDGRSVGMEITHYEGGLSSIDARFYDGRGQWLETLGDYRLHDALGLPVHFYYEHRLQVAETLINRAADLYEWGAGERAAVVEPVLESIWEAMDEGALYCDDCDGRVPDITDEEAERVNNGGAFYCDRCTGAHLEELAEEMATY